MAAPSEEPLYPFIINGFCAGSGMVWDPIFAAPFTERMAVIGKIRERSGLLLVLIGGALAAFILTDLFTGRGGPQDQVIGEVAGQEISGREFEARVDQELDSYREEFGQQVTAQMTEQVRNTVWNEIVREHVLLGQVRDAGFTITKPEYDDVRFGDNILPDLKGQSNFQGPDGQPDREALKRYFNNVQNDAPRYHEIQKRRITENRLYAKFNTLVKKSLFVNSAQATDDHLARNTKTTFRFVAMRYDSEPDSLYTVSDKELRRYHARHRNDPKHRQKPARKFEYVIFPVKPSAKDRENNRAELEALKAAFAAAENDSVFVLRNSDQPTYAKTPYQEGTADALTDSLIRNAAVGEVVGPYMEGESWKLVKVAELAPVPEARVRHILLSTQQGKGEDEQKRRADSLLAVVKRDRSKFPGLVEKFSDDPGSKSTGGVYEWFDKNRMVPEFTAASFDQKVGAITIAKTTYGYHIVEVLGQRERQERRVVSVSRTMKPSPATFKEVYKQANDFSLRYKRSLEEFRKGAEDAGLAVTPVDELRPDMRYVPGLTNPNTTIGWVNRAEVGAVSEPLEAGDNYVVAILTGIRKEGPPELEDVKEPFTREVMKEKKAESIATRMAGQLDLEALAASLSTTVQTAAELPYSTYNIPGGFSEYEVIGKIFALELGQTSIPLKGDQAVYVVNITAETPAGTAADPIADRNAMQTRVQNRAENAVFNALREAAGVRDDRYRYYN
jgi:peptidyl-prolyl cis-trans isomerase D